MVILILRRALTARHLALGPKLVLTEREAAVAAAGQAAGCAVVCYWHLSDFLASVTSISDAQIGNRWVLTASRWRCCQKESEVKLETEAIYADSAWKISRRHR
jgi:hypothetical protein